MRDERKTVKSFIYLCLVCLLQQSKCTRLENEVPRIKSYYSENSLGYAIFSVRGSRVKLNYFRGYENSPSDTVTFVIN